MKKTSIFSFFMALLLLVSVPFASADNNFKDIKEGFWASKEINELTSNNIISGYNDKTFKPNKGVTRAETAIMISRALNLKSKSSTKLPFKDVNSKNKAYKSIAAVYEANIMGGTKGKFQPNKGLTRSEMAVVLAKAFPFTETANVNFKDIKEGYYASEAIGQLLAYNITAGYADKTFKPNKVITRAEFAVLLSKALNADYTVSEPKPASNSEMAALLKEIQQNEIALESYEFKGSAKLGLSLPNLAEDSDSLEAMIISELLKDVNVSIDGVYVKNPMHIEMNMKLSISEELGLQFEMPAIMTKDALYLKLPDSELLGLPKEATNKFIYMYLDELADMSQEEAALLDLEMQYELMNAVNSIVAEHLNGFYSEVNINDVKYTAHPDAQKAIKFEVKQSTLKPFVETLLTDVMPDMLELMKNPKYAAALGLSNDDLKDIIGVDFDDVFDDALESDEMKDMLIKLKQTIKIKELSSHNFINENNIATDHFVNVDVDLTLDGEKMGLILEGAFHKTKINEQVTFKYGIPTSAETITLKELENLMPTYDDFDDYDDFDLDF